MRRLVVIGMCACVAAVAAIPAGASNGDGASFPNSTATWTGSSLKVAVACAAGGPMCDGHVTVYDPADTNRTTALGDGQYDIAAGSTATIGVAPMSSADATKIASLSQVVARAHPTAAPPDDIAEATLTVQHSTTSTGGAPKRPSLTKSNHWSGPNRARPRIDFSARYHRGVVIQLRRFSWDGLSCRGAGLPNTAQFSRAIPVIRRAFSHTETIHIEKGLTVKAWGHFNQHFTRASGYIEFVVGSGSCVGGSGRVHWVATPDR